MRCRNSLRLHAFTVLMLAANASASDHDLQQWTSLRLEHEFFDGVTAGIRARVRFDDDVSRDKDLTAATLRVTYGRRWTPQFVRIRRLLRIASPIPPATS
jgi:hypothetical protein